MKLEMGLDGSDNNHDLLILLTRKRNTQVYDLSDSQKTQVSNFSNFLACLFAPGHPKVRVARLALTHQIISRVPSLIDSWYQT